MKKIICLICAAALLASGCHHQKTEEKREDVQYAVCRRSMLPKELEEIIEEEKKRSVSILPIPPRIILIM